MKVVDPMRYADVAQWAWRAYDVEPPAQVVLVSWRISRRPAVLRSGRACPTSPASSP